MTLTWLSFLRLQAIFQSHWCQHPEHFELTLEHQGGFPLRRRQQSWMSRWAFPCDFICPPAYWGLNGLRWASIIAESLATAHLSPNWWTQHQSVLIFYASLQRRSNLSGIALKILPNLFDLLRNEPSSWLVKWIFYSSYFCSLLRKMRVSYSHSSNSPQVMQWTMTGGS